MDHISKYESDSDSDKAFDLGKYIQHKRPSLSASSVKTYKSILGSLYKKVFDASPIKVSNFNNDKKILEYLNTVKTLTTRKTILAALVVITDNSKYRDLMLHDSASCQEHLATNEKSETEKANWINTNELSEIWTKLKHTADLLYKKQHYTMTDLQEIQSYIILSVLGGVFIPPRRLLDMCAFKIKSIDKATDNYLEKNTMIYNTYKTSKTYNQQKVEIPTQLKSILTKWIKINPTDYLFFDKNSNPLTSVKLNQRLAKLLGNKSSINSIRHGYLTDKFGDLIQKNEQMDKVAHLMGTSKDLIVNNYIKKE